MPGTIPVTELDRRLSKTGPDERPLLLDVREPHEYAFCRLPGSINIPLGELGHRLRELAPDRETVVICHHGIRSAQAAMLLDAHGFSNVLNLSGGIDAWAHEVDPAMPHY